VLFTTGLASLGMEVVWTRQFTPYVGTFVYAFATILAVYLAATWLGSRTYRWWARVGRDDRGDWAVAWAAAGFLSLLPLAASDPRLPLGSGPAGGAMRVALGLVLYCAALGFLTPMLVDRWSGGDPERAGAAYAVNVLGGIVGPLLASFCLLPQLGERGALCALAAPLFAIGLLGSSAGPQPVSALAASRGNGRRAVLAVVAGATLALVALTRDFETTFPRRVVRRDSTATVTVVGEDMGKRLLVNGIGLAFLTPVTKMMSHLPLAFLPAPPRDCLVICFGMGTSYRSSLSWGIRTTAVELVPSVPALFSYFHDDGSELLKSPLGRIIIDDGRRFLERSPDQFDVITLDPPPPVEAAGSSLLYSREFYAVLKKRLRPGGILQQWLPNFPNTEPVILASVTRALTDSFPYVRVFRAVPPWGHHFLASMSPIPPTAVSVLAGRLSPRAVADLLEWGPASTAQEQFQAVLAGELAVTAVMEAVPEAPALSDDCPINEYFFVRRVLRGGSRRARGSPQAENSRGRASPIRLAEDAVVRLAQRARCVVGGHHDDDARRDRHPLGLRRRAGIFAGYRAASRRSRAARSCATRVSASAPACRSSRSAISSW